MSSLTQRRQEPHARSALFGVATLASLRLCVKLCWVSDDFFTRYAAMGYMTSPMS
jgi:hypothetical protein